MFLLEWIITLNALRRCLKIDAGLFRDGS